MCAWARRASELRIRLVEADALLRGGHFSGAYYLSGYAVECGLKACIARATQRYSFPDRNIVNRSYTHNLAELVKVAELESDLLRLQQTNRQFALNWAVVKDWSEESRYRVLRQQQAIDLYTAIVQRRHGVMTWIRQHW